MACIVADAWAKRWNSITNCCSAPLEKRNIIKALFASVMVDREYHYDIGSVLAM